VNPARPVTDAGPHTRPAPHAGLPPHAAAAGTAPVDEPPPPAAGPVTRPAAWRDDVPGADDSAPSPPWPYGPTTEEPESADVPVTGPTPDGAPILVFGPRRPPRRFARAPLVLVLTAAVVVALVAVSAALLMNEPDELAVPPAPARSAASASGPAPGRAVRLELADPVDRGNFVELTWRSSEPLDFAVIVAAEGETAKAVFVDRSTSYRIEVDPVRKYCFLVQGADGVQVYNSAPKAIRGATCTR
jgi:hypothetical protein